MRKDAVAGTTDARSKLAQSQSEWDGGALQERRRKGPKKGVPRWRLWELLGIKIISGTAGNTSPGSFLQKACCEGTREGTSIKEIVFIIVFMSALF